MPRGLTYNVSVAQLDRVLGYEPRGRGFESLQTRIDRKDVMYCVSADYSA